MTSPGPLSALYTAVLQMEKAASEAQNVAESLTFGASRARRAYEEARDELAENEVAGSGPSMV